MTRALIADPAAWIGPNIQHNPSWMHRFDANALREIDAALAHAKRVNATVPFSAEAFPLPTVSTVLSSILQEIEHGQGFKLLRGIPRERYTDAECEQIGRAHV